MTDEDLYVIKKSWNMQCSPRSDFEQSYYDLREYVMICCSNATIIYSKQQRKYLNKKYGQN